MEVLREVEDASGIKITGLINNSNLGEITTAEDVEESAGYADEVSKLSGLPVVYTTVHRSIAESVSLKNVMPIKLYVKQTWQDKA